MTVLLYDSLTLGAWAHKIKESSHKPKNLLDLPGEVRRTIWRYALPDLNESAATIVERCERGEKLRKFAAFNSAAHLEAIATRVRTYQTPVILLLNKQIFQEAVLIHRSTPLVLKCSAISILAETEDALRFSIKRPEFMKEKRLRMQRIWDGEERCQIASHFLWSWKTMKQLQHVEIVLDCEYRIEEQVHLHHILFTMRYERPKHGDDQTRKRCGLLNTTEATALKTITFTTKAGWPSPESQKYASLEAGNTESHKYRYTVNLSLHTDFVQKLEEALKPGSFKNWIASRELPKLHRLFQKYASKH